MKTGLATALVRFAYNLEGDLGWSTVATLGQTVALVESTLIPPSPEVPAGAMGIASASIALLSAFAALLM